MVATASDDDAADGFAAASSSSTIGFSCRRASATVSGSTVILAAVSSITSVAQPSIGQDRAGSFSQACGTPYEPTSWPQLPCRSSAPGTTPAGAAKEVAAASDRQAQAKIANLEPVDVVTDVMSPELIRSWARTEGLLREARANVSQIGESEFSDQLDQFDEFISHNELGLALDTLEAIAQEGSWESLRLLELLALAAASMGLVDRQLELDREIGRLRGLPYSTQLPPIAC